VAWGAFMGTTPGPCPWRLWQLKGERQVAFRPDLLSTPIEAW
jgi:hypothetical protein